MEQLDANSSRHRPARPEASHGSSSHGSRASGLVLHPHNICEACLGSSRLDSNPSHQILEMEACTSLTIRLVPSSRLDQGMVGSLECHQIHTITKVLAKHLGKDSNIKCRICDHQPKMM